MSRSSGIISWVIVEGFISRCGSEGSCWLWSGAPLWLTC